MKKVVKILSIVLVASILATLLISCAAMTRTYAKGDKENGVWLEMDLQKGIVKTTTYVTVFGVTSSTSTEQYYKIADGKYYAWDMDKTEDDALSFSFNEGEDDNGAYIEIGGIKYYRQK